MRYIKHLFALIPFACAGAAAIAQAQEVPEVYIYATYYNCDVTRQERTDEIVDSVERPVFDAAVADGTISSWGWLVHHTGGPWRRAQYFTAGSLNGLLDALQDLQDTLTAEDPEAEEELGEICNSHDDYIWRGITGNGGTIQATDRGNVSLSTYYVCDADEAEADALVRQVIGPVFDAHTGGGMLTSWGWSEHVVGGAYRRLATATAAGWPDLFEVRDSILEELADNELASRFGEICDSHADYMWEIRAETP